jgi:fanconi-associated nuclease 1
MFLYVRLFLRKKHQWFRIEKLGYYSDISDMSKASSHLTLPHIHLAEQDASLSDIDEALSLLSLDELKEFSRESKCSGTTKQQIISSISHMAKTQTSLNKCVDGQLTLSYSSKGIIESQKEIYIAKILRKTGPLIRLLKEPVALFHRLQTVFFRSTNYDENSLTTFILSKFSKRNFPNYVVQRSSNIFSSRDELIEYENAIQTKKEIDDILEGTPTKQELQRIIEIFEQVYPKWKNIIKLERGKSIDHYSPSHYYLQRYTSGIILQSC